MNTRVLAAAVAVAGLAIPAMGRAMIVPGSHFTSPINGHGYALLTSDLWSASHDFAVSIGANLATIRSSGEQTWVFNTFGALLGEPIALHIGLQDDGVHGFSWVTGEPVSFTNWASGEPNFIGIERFVYMLPPNPFAPGAWNNDYDRSNSGYVGNGYTIEPFQIHGVIEWVPSPGAAGPFGLWAAVLLKRRRPAPSSHFSRNHLDHLGLANQANG